MKTNLRIIQLIDSLETGGAERMAVNYANALQTKIEFSGLVTTRKEGSLKEQISTKVSYLFLNKTKKIDFQAIKKIYQYCKTNKIQFVQAHSSSYFLAVLIKLCMPKIKVIWHDHFGNRINSKKSIILKIFSLFFNSIITVNDDLRKWSIKNLYCRNVFYLPNFSYPIKNLYQDINYIPTKLNGIDNKRIVIVANLKNPKNHILALKSFNNSKIFVNDWSLHFVGKIFNDSYYSELNNYIDKNNLKNSVFMYDSCNDISNILNQVQIGLLTSTYEGFPVSLIEYGLSGLLPISSNVGNSNEIIKNEETGFIFNSNKVEELSLLLQKVTTMSNDDFNIMKDKYKCFISINFSWETIINQYVENINLNK